MNIFMFFPSLVHLILTLPLALLISFFFRIDRFLAPLISYCLLIFALFLFATHDSLRNGAYFLYLVLFCALLASVVLSFKKSNFRQYALIFLKENFLFSILLILSTIVFYDQIVGLGDEYNYWAIAVKELMVTHQLPGAESGLFYKSYHPGLALFHYFNLLPFGYSEQWIYGSYLALNLSALNIVQMRFRPKPILGGITFIVISYIGFRLLGIGIKSIIGDQFLIFGYFSLLVLLLTNFKKIQYWLLLPVAAIILAKQPGLALAYFILLTWLVIQIFEVLKKKYNRRKIILKAILAFSFFVYIKVVGGLWVQWANAHGANGLFLTTMHPESTSEYLDRLVHQGANPKEKEIISGFFVELAHLKFGMPLEVYKVQEKWPIGTWILAFILIVGACAYPNRRFRFPLNGWVMPLLSLVFWTFGLLILYTKVFSLVSEGPYPSIDRYFAIVFSPIFLFACYLGFLSLLYRRNIISKYTGVVVVAFVAVFFPGPGGLLLSEREKTQGRDEVEFFKEIKGQMEQVAKIENNVCILYQGSYRFNQRAIYDISPAKQQIIGEIKNIDFSKFYQNSSQCTHVLGFCLGPSECQAAHQKIPKQFTSTSEAQKWLVPWSDFAADSARLSPVQK